MSGSEQSRPDRGMASTPPSTRADPTLDADAGESGAALAAALAEYCRAHRPAADASYVADLERIFGGASRETWRFTWVEARDGGEHRHALILRRDPAASLIDTERRIEVAAYRAFADTAVPVPRIWWLEEDPAPLGSPFFVMEAITGCEAAGPALMQAPYSQHHEHIAEQKWTLLARIATTDPARVADVATPPDSDQCWRRELDHWAGVLDREAVEPQPIAQAAIRWLRANPPPPARRISIVHGDYRTGNFLVAPDGGIRAVLDWEMMHLGDPLEDLAWGLNRVWAFQNDERVGGLVARERAVSIWERASGLRADPAALGWWELFSSIKGQAIWQGAARAFESGANRDLMMAFAAGVMINSQDRVILDQLGHLS
ncbi:MAG: phosphotransferase family protein [Burkholderiaceae bacterium]